jgi:outer membrane protein assembly factor BamA
VIFFITGALLLACACSPTRRLKDKEYLLNRNVIIDRSASLFKLNPDLSNSDFEAYIKQKPNRKVGLIRFHLFLYNLIDPVKAVRKKRKRDDRWDRINKERAFKQQKENEKRAKKNKQPKPPKLKDKDRLTWREWVMDIGEPPVIYDSVLKIKTTQQLRLFLENKGYFKNTVRDSVAFKDKMATVFYIITPHQPCKVRKVDYTIKDPLLGYYVLSDTVNRLIHPGDNFDTDVLQKERERINKMLHNTGYYDFSKDYIYYKVDSFLNASVVDINMTIRQPMIKTGPQDSLVPVDHTRYYINEIYIVTDYNAKVRKIYNLPDDSAGLHIVDTSSYHIVYTQTLNYKPRLLTDAMYFTPGELFRVDNVEQTYKRLSDLRAFKFINIQFVKTGGEYLDCYIYLTPILKQTYTVESELTNTGGNRGLNGSFVYQNRNAFKGAEIFEFRLKGGFEVQKLLTDDGNNILPSDNVIPFNTFEIGPEASLTVPRFLLPFRIHLSQGSNPSTIFKTAYNYQQRPDYTLSTLTLSYAYTFNETRTKKHAFYIPEINRVNFTGKEKFQQYIDYFHDPLLAYRFSDHFTIDLRYAYVYSNQGTPNHSKGFSYLRVGAEEAGNLLRGYYNLLDQYVVKMDYDNSTDSYLINGIKFSQYLRSDFDFRHNWVFSRQNRLVFRFAAGIGKPLNNLRELPLEKSFFAGGPNGIRAWKARTLGPGSFFDSLQTSFDKIGDNQIETNLEYRFNIVRVLNAAAFVDAGNIWIRHPDPNRVGAEIKTNPLEDLDEFAIGAGLGIRLDFSFFVIRLDAAVPIKDPALPKGDRWTFDDRPLRRTNLNFGIGYPF